MTPLIETCDLSVVYRRGISAIPAVRGVSMSIEEGETLALVGESGCGKSTLALSMMGLIHPDEGSVTGGSIRFLNEDIGGFDTARWRSFRGKEIGMVFQDPFAALNPVIRIEEQLTEGLRAHVPGTTAAQLRQKARAALSETLFTDPDRILSSYPHQLSGGQRQRVVMAMAIINRPRLLITDEPTTALDVTIQKEILDLLEKIKNELSLTVLLITHNLPLACTRAQRVAVMYAGQIVECGRTEDIFKHPRHPYTRGLIASVPRLFHPLASRPLSGQPPDMSSLPAGCAFAPRCPEAAPQCGDVPPVTGKEDEPFVRCHHPFNK